MAKNKKTRKKYKPREVFYPQIMTRVNSFHPFEEALAKLIDTEEVELDENDHYIYRHPDGSIRAFESDLYLYARFIEIYVESKGGNINTQPLWTLRESLLAKGDLVLSEIIGIKDTLDICKNVLTAIKSSESRRIIEILQKEITQNS